MTVITLYPGRAAEEVEKQVTIPLEVALAGMPNAVRMFSHTQFGLSFIILTFDDKPTPYFARQQVLERLREADLPEGVHAAARAALDADRRDLPLSAQVGRRMIRASCARIQDWVVMRQLKLMPGVADVVSLGGLIKQYEVNPDLAKLRDYKVTLQQLFSALERGNANAGGSYIEQGRQQYLIRGIGLLRSADDIGNIVVAERNGVPVLVKDIAHVTIGAVPRQGIVGQDDDDDVVDRHRAHAQGREPVAGARSGVKAAGRAAERRRCCRKGVQIVPFYDRTWLIEQDAEDRVHEPARGRAARDGGAAAVPRQPARRVHRRDR